MPLTRDQLCELKSAADVIIKQLFKDETFLKTITDSVSNEIMKNLKQQLSSFEKKVETLEADINVLTEANKKVVKNLNDKIDLLNAKTSDCTGLSYNPLQIISEITEIKQRENNLLVFGILESALDSDAVKDVIRTVVPDFEMTGSKTYRLGKPSQEKNRPIRIIMPNNNHHSLLIKNNRKIQAVDQFKDIYIKPDQTVLQREHLIRLRQERKNRQDLGEQDLIIRYKNGIPVIAKKN
ncbi:hypothetical protein JTB14_020220 [Gonioctena quinquepunctata]|nr:hypothetical protein JTB14_020220 [Gonioctena quinquepunctata]